MASSTAEIHDMFRAGVHIDARLELVRCAARAHQRAADLLRSLKYPAQQAFDLRHSLFRADLESRLLALTLPGVSVSCRRTSGSSSCVELSTADVCITALTRSRLPTRLPKSVYRNDHERGSQLTMDASLFGVQPPPEARLYGVFVYGGDRDELRHARMYFPIPDAPLNAILPFDLLGEYLASHDSVAAEMEKARPTEETADIALGLKKKLKKTSDEK